MKKYFIFVIILLLSGCWSKKSEPSLFGMPEEQFRQLPSEQQQQIISSYTRQQEIRAKNEPMENLVNVLERSIKQQSRTTVQIHNHTIDQPVKQCRKEGSTQICDESVLVTQNNATNYLMEFDKT